MEILVKRKIFTDKSTIGEMSLDGAFQCYTLEDRRRADGVKIAHQTAIPSGTYDVIIGHSNRFNRQMPRVQNVPMFDGILIHYGNTAVDTDGCILVGNTKAVDFIGESRLAFSALFEKLQAADSITLTIVDEPEADTRSGE